MAQTGYTPISIYYSATTTNVPTAGNLVAGELAINTADGKLFYKDSAGVVQVIAGKGGAGVAGGSNTQVQYNSSGSLAGSANMVFDGFTLTTLNTAYTGTLTGGTGVVNLGSGQFYKDASGNVGIGRTNPGYKLDIAVSAGGNAFSATDLATSDFRIVPGVSSGIVRVGPSSGGMAFYSSDSERMRIDSSGNICINATSAISANSKLNIIGSATSSASTIKIGTDGYAAIDFRNSAGAQQGYVQTNTSTVLYVSVSDYRLKENIAPMKGALSKVQSLKPCTYTWKNNNSSGQGFIAHELQAVIPDCVTGEKDAVDAEGKPVYQGIDTSFLVATLTAALQELNAKVDAQALEIATLKAK